MSVRPSAVAGRCLLAVLAVLAGIAGACASFGATPETAEGVPGAEASVVDSPSSDSGASALFCQTRDAALCWSFDEPPHLLGRELQKEEVGGGVVELATELLTTAPYGARLTSGNAGAVAGVFWTVSGKQAMTCEGDVVVVTAPDNTLATIAQLPLEGSVTPLVNATASGGTLTLTLSIGASTLPLGIAPLKERFHLRLGVDAAGVLVRAQVNEGKPGATGEQTMPVAVTNTPASFFFFLAIPGWSMVVDDLVCVTR